MNKFPTEIHADVGYYVYKLIDPRDGRTFYVGKGKGDRVFAHAEAALASDQKDELEDDYSLKIRTIRDLLNAGLHPVYVIHRHGLDEQQALLAEAVLIDATPGLTNILGGHGSNFFGPCAPSELALRYRAEVMEIAPNHKIIGISVRRSAQDKQDFYHSVRHSWRISKARAERADFVFAVVGGICRAVFVPNEWVEATTASFPDLNQDIAGRWGFHGVQASREISALYVGKRLPPEMQRRKGMASPILYSYL